MKSYEQIGNGKICRKCNIPTMIRRRTKLPKDKLFYFVQWEYCKKCNSVYFDEKYKNSNLKMLDELNSREQCLFDINRE